jgi:glutathione S-transferase
MPSRGRVGPPPAERADYYRWMFFAAGPVEAAMTDKARGITISPEQGRMVGYGSYERAVDLLEQAVARTSISPAAGSALRKSMSARM